MAEPTIASQMPVAFDQGGTFTDYQAQCRCCGQDLPAEMVRGVVRRPRPDLAEIEAVGICHPCKRVTSYFHRLHADMRITGRSGSGWGEWRPATHWYHRLARMLGL